MTDEEIKRFKENHEKLKQDIAWLRKYIKIYSTQDFLNEDIVIRDMEEKLDICYEYITENKIDED